MLLPPGVEHADDVIGVDRIHGLRLALEAVDAGLAAGEEVGLDTLQRDELTSSTRVSATNGRMASSYGGTIFVGAMKPRIQRRIVSSFSCMVAVLVCALASATVAAADAHTTETQVLEQTLAPGERALVGRLVAPCCWQQTLDVHTGPMADALRAEVRRRLWAGEAAERIEADFAARYGARVLGVPDGNPIVAVTLGIGATSLLAAAGLFVVLRRWRRRAERNEASPSPSEAARDAYDERLDDELRAM